MTKAVAFVEPISVRLCSGSLSAAADHVYASVQSKPTATFTVSRSRCTGFDSLSSAQNLLFLRYTINIYTCSHLDDSIDYNACSGLCSPSTALVPLLCCAVAEEQHLLSASLNLQRVVVNNASSTHWHILPTHHCTVISYHSDNSQSCSKCKWVLPAMPSPFQLVHRLSLSTAYADFHCSLHCLQQQAFAE